MVVPSKSYPFSDRTSSAMWSSPLVPLQLFFFVRARCLSAGLRSWVLLADQRGSEPPPAVCQRHKSAAIPTAPRGRLRWFSCSKSSISTVGAKIFPSCNETATKFPSPVVAIVTTVPELVQLQETSEVKNSWNCSTDCIRWWLSECRIRVVGKC